MKRFEGTKLSVPQPEGYKQVTEGEESIRKMVARGGVTMVKSQDGGV